MEKMEQILAHWRDIPGNLVPVLQEAQRLYGHLPVEVLESVAAGLDLPLSQVASVASFYSFFHGEKYGRYVIRMCKSAPCHVKDAGETLAALEKELGIPVGNTTEDGVFTLLTCECLGVCDRAPAVMVNETVYGPVRPEDVPGFLKRIREEAWAWNK